MGLAVNSRPPFFLSRLPFLLRSATTQQVEGGIHALGKGNPLPPPRHGKSSEPERSHVDGAARNADGVQPAAAATATAPAGAGASTPFDVRESGREAGGARGTADGSRRNGTAFGAAGSVSAQVRERSRNHDSSRINLAFTAFAITAVDRWCLKYTFSYMSDP